MLDLEDLRFIPFPVFRTLQHDGVLPTAAPASIVADQRAEDDASGREAARHLGLLVGASGVLTAPGLLESLRIISESDTRLLVDWNGLEFGFVALGESLVPWADVSGGLLVGEPRHLGEVARHFKRRLQSTGGLGDLTVLRHTTQALVAVWTACGRSAREAVSLPEAAAALALSGLLLTVDELRLCAQGWLVEDSEAWSIAPSRRKWFAALLQGHTMRLMRQEGLALVLDEELVGRDGAWAFTFSFEPETTEALVGTLGDELVTLVSAAPEDIDAVVGAWVGTHPTPALAPV
ncbi:MAG: hypothetical protein SFW67_34695 [Myxococcaceae bacterium]|nr:hypothetical protein [Myxococcaceae bacterium]